MRISEWSSDVCFSDLIVTNLDLRFQKDMNMPISELMTKENLVVAPVGTDLLMAEEILQNYKIEKLPVVDSDGHLVGLITRSEEHTSELQSLMRISYAVFCLKKKTH